MDQCEHTELNKYKKKNGFDLIKIELIKMRDTKELFDRQVIIDVMHAYCRLVDLNIPERQVECFTSDAVADYYGGVELVGREEILGMLKKALSRFTATCHTLSNIEISFDGEVIRKDGLFIPDDWQKLNQDYLMAETA